MKEEVKIFLVAFFVSGGIYAAMQSISDSKDQGEFSPGEFFSTFLLWGLFQGFLFVWLWRKKTEKNLNQKNEEKNELK